MYNGKLVYLRALELSDLDAIMEHWNSWELRRSIGVPLPSSEVSRRHWLETMSKADPWKDGELNLAIIDKKTGRFLGIIGLRDIVTPHRRAEFGISIHNPQDRSKGYGTDATRVMLWIGFHILGLQSIYLDTFPDNKEAYQAYVKAGFKEVGLLRNTEFREGQNQDLLIMDIIRKEFFETYPPGTTVGTP
ncbi:MAG: GNAT family N-acetyltransferase [Candidatus Thorarchaeota archaeon]|jgi:RimJ/RimL family protein N-acetyltransferase